ncbi:sodium/proline symporter PutP [Echinimonas agarilytica]|uniref:Sodium/proline symporter n=1 Tax=Echinimonas agarilytica TaxID=1215918 RepID=A0AA41WA94_9GAMM|nr:sodium/proline symporter PutP [Echinimonas agarilytica]MCM2681103.1 sodium/proline symporter PutP [Echinimonas agarilytica]
MFEVNASVITTFAAYLVIMFAIGLWAFRQTHGVSDYFLGGRNLGPLPAALSAGASDMSGWLLLGLPGYAYLAGFEAIWLAIGLMLGFWLNWLLMANRLRRYTIQCDDALTVPEYLSRRFDDKSGALQMIAAVVILVFFLFYTGSGLVAGGKLFATVFGLDYHLAVTIGAVCVVSYTLFGGFLAVTWTDVVQGLLMMAALLVVPVVILSEVNGDLVPSLNAINPHLTDVMRDVSGTPLSWIAIVSLVAWGLGYFGQPHILARFAATRSDDAINTARKISVTWNFLCQIGALLVGMTGLVYLAQHGLGPLDDSETVFIHMVNMLFHPWIAGVLLAAILAAVMSTADSQLLVSSSAFTEDLYRRWLRPDASQEELVWAGRIAVMAVCLMATVLAWNPDASVLELVGYAWAGFGAAFGPVLLLSLYWRGMNRAGALSGMLVGGATVVIWRQLSGGIFDLYEILPGVVFALIAIFIGSKLGAPATQKSLDDFDAIKNT